MTHHRPQYEIRWRPVSPEPSKRTAAKLYPPYLHLIDVLYLVLALVAKLTNRASVLLYSLFSFVSETVEAYN
jgi:hypothetical protein